MNVTIVGIIAIVAIVGFGIYVISKIPMK